MAEIVRDGVIRGRVKESGDKWWVLGGGGWRGRRCLVVVEVEGVERDNAESEDEDEGA